jgi:hypothetical protein
MSYAESSAVMWDGGSLRDEEDLEAKLTPLQVKPESTERSGVTASGLDCPLNAAADHSRHLKNRANILFLSTISRVDVKRVVRYPTLYTSHTSSIKI